MLHYILQTVAFQLFFLIIYDVFLKKETFFNWNRFYLLITAVASVVIPFIKFEGIRTIVPEQFVVRLPEVIIGEVQPVATNLPIVTTSEISTVSNFIWSWDYLLYAGMLLASMIFIYKIIKISDFIDKNPKRWKNNLIIVSLLKSKAAFSFFNYIFLGEWIKEEEKEAILKHELVHVTQKHSLDLLLFEVLRILFWFNPLIYLYQNRITHLHEYIADAKVMSQTDKKQYYEKLLSQVFETESISFTNTFFNQSLIKKRIIMLSKSKSHRIHLLKYALLIPIVFGMLVYTSSYGQKGAGMEVSLNQELTLKELMDKYYKELVEADSEMENYKEYLPENEKYISSIDEVARGQAFVKYLFTNMAKKRKKDGALTEDIKKSYESMVSYDTYEDYLADMKTDKAKRSWESRMKNGVLRLFVEDMKNMTDSEKKKQQDKIDLILKDDFFHSLLITDGKASSRMEINSIDGKKTSHPNNTDDIVIVEESIEVPFSIIDEVPTVEECENLATNEEKRQCFSEFISAFVGENFNTKLGKELGLKGRQRITVLFKIGTDGRINEVMSRAPHPDLEAEAIRVIKALPKMIPGRHKGKSVIVPYSLPIVFQVADSGSNSEFYKENSSIKNIEESDEVPFSVVDEAPTFEECKDLGSQDEVRSCTSDIISNFVNKNFNSKLGKELGLKGNQRVIVVFRIGKDGTIDEVKSRAGHPALEAEAIRVVKTLPQMIPGKQGGKNVAVPYALPIIFEVSE